MNSYPFWGLIKSFLSLPFFYYNGIYSVCSILHENSFLLNIIKTLTFCGEIYEMDETFHGFDFILQRDIFSGWDIYSPLYGVSESCG